MGEVNRYITKIARNAQYFMQRQLRDKNLGPSEYECLHCVRKKKGLTPVELSRMMNIDKSAVTRMVTNMENKGYLVRVTDTNDRRCKHIYVTEAAAEVKSTSHMGEVEFYDWLLSGISPAERKEFLRILEILYRRSKAEREQDFIHVENRGKE